MSDLYTDTLELIFQIQNLECALRYILRQTKAPEPFIDGLIKECREDAHLRSRQPGNKEEPK